MQKWIAGSTCAAAVLSLAVASAQTYPQTPDNQPATKAPSSTSGQTDTSRRGTGTNTSSATPSNRSGDAAQRVTITGCVMQGSSGSQGASASSATGTNAGGWILSNATMSNQSGSNTTSSNTSATGQTSRSGSPSNEGTSAGNRNGTAGAGVSGSTSTTGTSRAPGGSVDTEAHGAGTVGATDQSGSTVGAGATAGATANSSTDANNQTSGTSGGGQVSGTAGTTSAGASTTSAGASSSYQLSELKNPNQYSGKRVEITGTLDNARADASSRRNSNATSAGGNNTMPMLKVTSVRVVGENCQ
jgi:hypothetical protein